MESTHAAAIVRHFIDEVWNQGNEAAVDTLTTPTYRYTLAGQPPRDRAALREFLRGLRTAFPDWRVAIVDVITQGHRAAVQWEARATHRGPFLGFPATGRTARVSGTNVYHLDGEHIAAEFEQMDTVGLLTQLGLVPPRIP